MSALQQQNVLVVAADPLLAALVGAIVESTALRAEFPRSDETAEQALERIRPMAAILMDAVLEQSGSDLFLARARRRNTVVMLFGQAPRVRQRRPWADQNDVPCFALPEDMDALCGALSRLRAPGSTARTNNVPSQSASIGAFQDSAGVRWSVYDRRLDRRRNIIDRRFVSDRGEVRRCSLTLAEAEARSANELSRQLERAVADSAG